MMTKFFLLLVVLFLAYGVVVWLLKRLTDTTRQLAELRSEMSRNDEILTRKLAMLQEQKSLIDEQKAGGAIGDLAAGAASAPEADKISEEKNEGRNQPPTFPSNR